MLNVKTGTSSIIGIKEALLGEIRLAPNVEHLQSVLGKIRRRKRMNQKEWDEMIKALEVYCAFCKQRIAPHHINSSDCSNDFVDAPMLSLTCNNSKCGKRSYIDLPGEMNDG